MFYLVLVFDTSKGRLEPNDYVMVLTSPMESKSTGESVVCGLIDCHNGVCYEALGQFTDEASYKNYLQFHSYIPESEVCKQYSPYVKAVKLSLDDKDTELWFSNEWEYYRMEASEYLLQRENDILNMYERFGFDETMSMIYDDAAWQDIWLIGSRRALMEFIVKHFGKS